jgi:enamine deaminase RidA (YjgF/YER057c/UK114 family)
MTDNVTERTRELLNTATLSQGEREELIALGVLSQLGEIQPSPYARESDGKEPVRTAAITAHSVLNEAYDYGSAFSRGLRLELGHYTVLFISGTASVDEAGDTAHLGDIRAQCWRTYRNITTLLETEGATWRDVVKTTCFLRDIERDYDEFNDVRTTFFKWQGLDPLPASVGIQARLCREDLLVEIEAIVVLKKMA